MNDSQLGYICANYQKRMTKRFCLYLAILTWSMVNLFAAEPTIPPSNLKFSGITCSSAIIQWTPGNGTWNIVVIREAAAVNGPPVDGTKYTSFPTFGSGDETTVGNGNFVCFSNLTNSFSVNGLKMNTQYYVCVYSHDGASSPDYLTSSAACGSFTSDNVNMDFEFSYSDTCQNTNKVKFINKSKVTFASPTYVWRFYNAPPSFDQAYTDTVNYTWTKPGNKKIELYLVPKGGCSGTKTKSLLIYSRAKPAPFVIGSDTLCYNHGNNHFFFGENTTADFSSGVGLRRNWFFPNDTFTVPNPDVKNLLPGNYNILYVGYTIYNNSPTGCYDSVYLPIRVVPDPSSGVTINDSIQCLTNNQFLFDNVYPGLVSFSWDFGDGSTKAIAKSANHAYTAVGIYDVIHNAASQEGCKSADTTVVLVKPNMIATFNNLPSVICEAASSIKLKPVKSGGIFSGQFIVDSTFNPKTPGIFKIKYVVPDQFCPDSTTQSITVNPLPRFSLGRDTNLCNGGTLDLSISAPGFYLWDNGTSASTRTIGSAGTFWAEATDKSCVWRDSINLFLGTTPALDLPMDTLLCKGGVLRLHAYYPGSKTTWNSGSNDTTIYVTSAGTYTATVANPCGSASDQITVRYAGEYCDVFIPDAFTPNADGKNEIFQIYGRGLSPNLFIIYNRWGQIVFDSRISNTYGWDGNYNGQPCIDGVYNYLFYYEVAVGVIKRRNTIKGSVLLYR